MQQQSPMFPVMPSFPPANITTEQIQKYLDENKKLILAILDNQNLGKLAECAQYQALLQKNLMYLAAIADAQPQTPTMQPQMSPYPPMPQGAYYMQHPHAPAVSQQPGLYPQTMPLQFDSPLQIPDQQQQLRQQVGQGQMSMRPAGSINGLQPAQNAATVGGASGGHPAPLVGNDGREANKQDAGGSGQESLAAGHDGEEANHPLKIHGGVESVKA
ncbi:transcription cofactor [Lithospermum erythrorhizon]|uniref:Transcription cofactor n=1 Tax=Lithospermum erythrorhizon TaxID=34254 RepID=A0AAV3RQ80_LITER